MYIDLYLHHSNMASWSKDSILHFIDMYRSLECLWKIKSKEYSNKHLKEKAYERLVELCQEFDHTANKDTVTKKINNLRSSFRKELKKEEQSSLCGAGSDEIYEPKLWYFQDLMFLKDQQTPRAGRSSMEASQPAGQHERESDLPEAVESLSPKAESEASTSLGDQQGEEDPQPPHSTQSTSGRQPAAPPPPPAAPRHQQTKHDRKRKCEHDDEILKVARARLFNPVQNSLEDECDIFGKGVACRLRNLPRDQRIHAQKYISDILYEGELGQLSPATSRGFMPTRERCFIPSNSNTSHAYYTTAGNSGNYDDPDSENSQ